MSFGAQDETVRFLMAQEEGAETILTHISIVVLAKERVFKLKRGVTFPYLDFSTPQLRLAMCEREFTLNRRTAPALYLAARRITRERNGALCFDGDGELVDAVVEMRRFEQDALLDRLALDGALTLQIIEKLAERIAAFHDAAEFDTHRGGALVMSTILDLGESSSLASSPAITAAERLRLGEALRSAPLHHRALLDGRRDAGKVRRCHGDLTLRNICLIDGVPTPFDCIEFSDDLATIDILYDLAFLLMDLWRRDQRRLANLALNRYLDHRDETDGLPLLPFFMALRAAIRADVAAAQAAEGDTDRAPLDKEARDYFDLASSLLRPASPQIVAIGGLSGTGKSSVSAALAPLIGAAPGARVMNSDRLRKQLFSVAPTTRLAEEAYGPEVSVRVYEALQEQAGRVAATGWTTIVDAVYARASERDALEAVARRAGVPFAGFWLEADPSLCDQRVAQRRNDVSDATSDVLARQRGYDTGEIEWTRIDASRSLQDIARDIASRLPPPRPSPARAGEGADSRSGEDTAQPRSLGSTLPQSGGGTGRGRSDAIRE